MRNKDILAVALVLAAIGVTGIVAAEDSTATENEPPPNRPENTVRPLPADTFLPSEEISEDFPVPFPVDI